MVGDDAGIILFAKEPDSFKKFYEAFKQDFLKFIEKYQEFVKEHGRHPEERELEALVKEWLEEVSRESDA